MRKTRAVTLTALVAGAAMVFAACSSPGQSSTNNTSSSGTGTGTTSSGTNSTASSTGVGSSSSANPVAPPQANNASTNGCGTPHGAYTQPTAPAAGTVVTGLDELATSWNDKASHDNSVYNEVPHYLTQAQGYYYDNTLQVINNDSFLTCVVTSKSPLTVKYTINSAAKWSDGVPVTADDLLMTWIAYSGKYNTVAAPPTDKDGNPVASSAVAFDASDPGMALITQVPVVSGADRKTLTVTYSKPFVDYQLGFGIDYLPAHVIGQKALGISDPTQAVEGILTAAQKDDKVSLSKISNFWNTGFDFSSLPSDKSLYLSSGPYLLTGFKANQYMTFTVNPDYTWGPKPTIKTITYEYLNNATTAVQAIQNGEVNMIWPQHPTADLTKSLDALSGQGVKSIVGVSGAYEHVDLAFKNKGPFDPASYGGDAAKANDVRQAFLKTIPRQDIVDRLMKPVSADATVRDSFTQVPGSPWYKGITATNGMSAFDKVDIAGAKALLAQAGVTKPTVRILYSATSTTRQQEFQLIQQSAQQAGFNVVADSDPNWASNLPNTGKYDASIFGWINTTLGIAQIPPNFLSPPAGQNNYGGYSNPQVDTWLNQLNITSDPAAQLPLITKTEAQLVKDGFGTILYQDPDVVGYDSNKVTGVSSIPVVPGMFWDFWNWKLAS